MVKSLSARSATVVRLGLHPEVAPPELRKLPAAVRQTLPAVLREDGEVFLPRFDFLNDYNGLRWVIRLRFRRLPCSGRRNL